MQIEYEATFININKDEIREKLRSVGAELIRPEFFQKRVTFNLPAGHEIKGGWIRVLDTGEKHILSLKIVDGSKIKDQKEININVGSFTDMVEFLKKIGCQKKAYQETKRELWILDGVEITIDEWPFLEPYVEVEGKSENEVKKVSEKIGFNYRDALFCCVSTLYSKKYNISEEIINNQIPKIIFEGENPLRALVDRQLK
jgi:adenylate cyclase class 2